MKQAKSDPGFDQFERFLEHWSRRDFLKTVSIGAAYAAFLAGGVAALDACLNAGQQNTNTNVTPQKGGSLIEGWSTEPGYLLPVRASDVYSNIANRLLFEGLLSVDNKGNLVAAMAQDLPKVSSDNLTYTFKLKPDIKWSDGSPLTPEDAVFSYSLYYDPKYDDINSNSRPNAKRYIKSMAAQGDSLVLTATQVYAPFLSQFGGIPIVPKSVLGNLTGAQLNTAEQAVTSPPLSNGKFKFGTWKKGEALTLNRNDKYYGGPVNIDTWVYKKVADSVAVLQQLKTGEIDVGRLDPATYDEAKAQSNLKVLSFDFYGWDEFIFQLDPNKPQTAILKDKNVRQALVYGLDRQAIVNASYFGQATVADSIFPHLSWAYDKNVQPKYNFDAAKAKSMLDAAGWTAGSDGMRAKAGQKLSFDMSTNADNTVRVKNLQIMQEQWKKIGVDAQVKTVADLVQSGNNLSRERNFGILFIGFSLNALDPDQSGLWHSRAAALGGNNGGLYKSPDVDKLLDDAVITLDKQKRIDLYKQLQNKLADDLPSCILCYTKGIYGINKRVHNYDLNAFWVYGGGAEPYMKNVWVEPKK
jgi:peptide/nickel transport system substrate-binding protein